jgi:exopolysaccharide production protein ExoZ
MNSGSSTTTLYSIQILRGAAALLVVLYHLPDFIGLPSYTFLTTGVDLFFVISGCVIMLSTMQTRGDVLQFLWKRMVRVAPLYWLVTLAFALVWALTGLRELRIDQLALSLLFIPYLDSVTGYIQPLLSVGWTLNLELYFYLLFALTMFLRPPIQLIALTGLFVGLIAVKAIAQPHEQNALLFFYTMPIMLEFAGGMALALALPRLQSLPRAVGFGLLGGGVLLMVFFGQDFGLPREVSQGVPAMMIATGAIIAEPCFRARWLAPFHALGDASYALYLTHLVVLTLLRPLLAGRPWWAAGLVMLTCCTAIALAVYRFVEQSLMRWARSVRIAQPQAPVS